MNNLIGQHLGPYRIMEQIGMGGMAMVYKAYQPAMDRYVAIKVIASHFAQEEEFLRRFRREARAVAQLEHAHILPVHDYGEAEGRPYLVMRYLEAGTLKERMAQGPLSLSDINRVVGQVGSALDYAHRMGVVHRDVKPANILMDAEGDTFLTDFGLAKMLESSAQLTETGVGIGTPTYMSPEQGQAQKVDSRTDVYSLGVILYEMVTGRAPYEAETPLAVVLKHITEPLPLPRSIQPDLPEEVERVILRALAKEPDDRYQTAGEMVRALDAAVRAAEAAARTEPGAAARAEPAVTKVAGPPAEGALARAVAGVRKALPAGWGRVAVWVAVGIITLVALFLVLSRVPLKVQISGGQLEVVRVVKGTATQAAAIGLVDTPTHTPTAAPTHISAPTPTNTPTPAPTPIPSLSGRVTDAATGQGVGGARIEVQLAGHDGWDYSATTTSDGSYAIFDLPTGDYVVRVTAPGYAREYYDNVTPSHEAKSVHVTALHETPGIDFDLTEGGSISGYVYQSDGITPISGVEVDVQPSGEEQNIVGFAASTASDGSYTIEGLALGEYRVGAKVQGWVEQWTDVIVTPPEDTPNINFRLSRGGSISGFVYESDGVTPVQGVAVCAENQLPSGEYIGAYATTRADGSYVITDLTAWDYLVRVERPAGFAPECYDSKYVRAACDMVTVREGSDTSGVNFTLDPGGSVTVHVYEEDGLTPIRSGIDIGVWLSTKEFVGWECCTKYDGSYTFWLRTGSYLIRPHTHGKYVDEWYDNHYDMNNADPIQVVAPHETSGIDFYLAKAGSISGHVYEEDGVTPIAGSSVYAFPITGDRPGAGANTSPDGSYTIEGLPSGNYKVQVTVSNHVAEYYNNAPDEASATEVTVNAPNNTPGIDFALSPVSE